MTLLSSLPASNERSLPGRSPLRRALFASALALLLPAVAHAQSTAATLPLDIDPSLDFLDESAFRVAVDEALGLSSAGEPSDRLGTLLVRSEGPHVAVVFVTTDGRVVSRKVSPSDDRKTFARALAFAAGNLIRDEASEILASLHPPAVEVDPEPAPAPAPAPVPVPVPAPESPAPEATGESPLPPCSPTTLPIGVDLAPFVGTSTGAPDAVRAFSFNLVGGYSQGLHGFELSAGVNIESGSMCGLQIAGAGNFVGGPVRGLQLAPINVGGPLRGAQLGVVGISTGAVSGAQIGVVSIAGESVKGAQIGVVNAAGGDVLGTQLGVVNITGQDFKGSQIAVVNVTGGDAERLQMGVANIAGGSMRGAQMGVTNVVGEDVGTQLGVVNIAPGKVSGVQMGVFNYAGESDVSIGLVSVVKDGRTSLEAFGTADGTASLGVRHGGRVIHNIFAVGHPFGTEGSSLAFTVGLGGRVPLATRLHLDIDGTLTTHSSKPFFENPPQVSRLAFLFGYEVTDSFGIFGGPSADVIVSREDSPFPEPVWGSTSLQEGRTRVAIAPGATLGLRFDVQKLQPRP